MQCQGQLPERQTHWVAIQHSINQTAKITSLSLRYKTKGSMDQNRSVVGVQDRVVRCGRKSRPYQDQSKSEPISNQLVPGHESLRSS